MKIVQRNSSPTYQPLTNATASFFLLSTLFLIPTGIHMRADASVSYVVRLGSSKCPMALVHDYQIDKLKKRLRKFSSLQKDWAVEGSLPINPKVIELAISACSELCDKDIWKWQVYPDIKGSIVFNYRDEHIMAAVSVSDKAITFFRKTSGADFQKGVVELTVQNIKHLLKKEIHA